MTEPVLDVATDAEVKAQLAKGAKPYSQPRTDYWLTGGLVACPCGGSLHGKGRRGSRNQPQYGCSRNRPGEATNCSYAYRRYWDARELEDAVWGSLILWLVEDRFPFSDDDEDTINGSEELEALADRISGLDAAITQARADLYDPEKALQRGSHCRAQESP